MSPTDSSTSIRLVVACEHASGVDSARSLAERLGLPFVGVANPRFHQDHPLLLSDQDGRLALIPTGKGAPGAVYADFVEGALAHRRLYGGGRGQPVAKAVGLKPGINPRVLDATAGLGRDAFVLASLGCSVTLLERSPIIAALLADALARAGADPEVAPIAGRMQLIQADAIGWLSSQTEPVADVVFLDPMFPHREKSSLVKKEMQVFQSLLGQDLDADQLLDLALERARYRVVVKRPRLAPFLAQRQPTLSQEGKSGRFDIYALRSLDDLKSTS